MGFFEKRIANAVYGLFKPKCEATRTEFDKLYPHIERLNSLTESVDPVSKTDPSQGVILTMCDGSKYLVNVLPLKE